MNLSNYPLKTDLKSASGVDTWNFAKKVDLTNLKYNVDKLDIDKPKTVPTILNNLKIKADKLDASKLVSFLVNLSKLCDVVIKWCR